MKVYIIIKNDFKNKQSKIKRIYKDQLMATIQCSSLNERYKNKWIEYYVEEHDVIWDDSP